MIGVGCVPAILENTAQLGTKVDRADVRGELTAVRGELALVKRMLGFNLALSVAILLRLLVR